MEKRGSLRGIELPVRGQRPKTDQRLVLLNQLLQLLAATLCVCVQASLDLRDLLALRYIERILASKASLGCSQYID